ncbi:hypothetical protein AB0B45_06770 [Nonomuraea sp. NPDC049152]|uniref:hypothetical protein n=1 Tax=Nonomuraea sp. NPDC049152 TaxID=3154350 RepID=UPI0033DFABEC
MADQAGWPAPPDQIDQQFQPGPSTGEWAMPPQHPDAPGSPATGPMSAHEAFGAPVSAFGGGPSAGGPSPFDDRGSDHRGFDQRGPDHRSFDDRGFDGPGFGDQGQSGPGFGDAGFGDHGFRDHGFRDQGHGGSGFGDPGLGDAAFGGPGFGEPAPGGTPYGGQGFDEAAGPAMDATAAHSSPNDRLVATGPPRQPIAAWEEAPEPNETAFLGAGGWDDKPDWEDEPEDKSSRRRRGRRRPAAETRETGQGGRSKIALLSVAAVAIVLGGTVVGVRMVSSSGEKPSGNSVSASKPAPSTSDIAEPDPSAEESEPVTDDGAVAEPTEEEPTQEPSATRAVSRPRPTTTTAEREPRRTSTPRPTPKRTTPPVVEDGEPTGDPTPSVDPSNMKEADATGQPGVTDSPGPVTSSTSGGGSGSGSDSQSSSTRSGGAAVNVRFDVVRQRLAGYTAELQVVNDSARALTDWTLSVPVVGTVSAVPGAQWMQDGGLLVIQPGTTLAAGESVQVTFTAVGTPDAPESCGLVGGECTVG